MKPLVNLPEKRRVNYQLIPQIQAQNHLIVMFLYPMVASEQEALEEIEDAIDRIFDGTYGICQEAKNLNQENTI